MSESSTCRRSPFLPMPFSFFLLFSVTAVVFASTSWSASAAGLDDGFDYDPALLQQHHRLQAAKRFYSWEGKRYSNRDKGDVDKRKFYQWAGKRSPIDERFDLQNEKRKFYQWAGKRNGGSETSNDPNIVEKRKFYQWAG